MCSAIIRIPVSWSASVVPVSCRFAEQAHFRLAPLSTCSVMQGDAMIIRQARAVDIPALVALRMQLFCEVVSWRARRPILPCGRRRLTTLPGR